MKNEISRFFLEDRKEILLQGLSLVYKNAVYSFLPQTAALITHPDPEVAKAALRVCLYLAEDCFKSTFREIPEAVIPLAKELIKKYDPAFVDKFLRQLDAVEPEAVIEAIIVVKNFIDERRAKKVMAFFHKYPESKVRATAALHLGALAAKTGVENLTAFLEDTDNRVRANTIEVLEQLNNKNLVRVISRFRQDKNNRVRANVIKALFTLGERNLVPDLEQMLYHEKALMRTSAVWVIGEIGSQDKNFLRLLRVVANDPDQLLQKNLLLTLKKIGPVPELDFLREKQKESQGRELKAKIIKDAPLQVVLEKKAKYCLFRLTGNLTMDTVLSLKLHLQEIELSRNNQIVLDFTRLEHIDSSGVALLANFTRFLEPKGGFLFIFGCVYRVSEIIQITKLDRALRVFETLEEIDEFLNG
jgi:anti-anti-sigma factor